MRVFIYVYDNIYSGHYGLENQAVCDVKSFDEIDEIYYEEACSLLDSYGCYEEYIAEYDEDADYVRELTSFECWKIRDDVTLDLNTLDEAAYRLGKDAFVEEYCSLEEVTF